MKLQRIVVGVDFSATSLGAVHWMVNQIAPEAEYYLVHGLDLPQPPPFLRGLLPTRVEVVETAMVGAEQRLQELAATLSPIRAHAEVRCGHPSVVVPAYAQEIGADLIVIGEHGQRQGLMGLPGTTAERVLHTATVPVLVSRGVQHGKPSGILAPIDASAISGSVLQWAGFLHDRFGASITAFYAVSPWLYGRIRNISGMARERALETELLAGGTTWVNEQLAAAKLIERDARAEVVIGDPRYEIPAAAQRTGADFIVMGSRGAGAVGRAMVGSVACAVLRTTAAPVLVVPGHDGG